MKHLIITLAMIGSAQAYAAQPCDADASVAAFSSAAKSAVAQMPAINHNIDWCFNNVDYPSYVSKAKKVLGDLGAQFKDASDDLDKAYDSLKTGRDAEFVSAVNSLVAKTNSAMGPMESYARNLKSDGFTTSDRKNGSDYVYPKCNSQTNDNPAGRWATFYATAQKVKSASKALLTTAACLKK